MNIYETDVTTGAFQVREPAADELAAWGAHPPVLGVSANTLQADGTDEVTVELVWSPYADIPTSVDFDLNGVVETVTVTDDRAVLGVTADQPGFIDITVEGQTTSVEAI